MKFTARTLVILLLLQTQGSSVLCAELEITRIFLHPPHPGDFFGNSTIPDSCTGTPMTCHINPLTDGEYGGSSPRVTSSQLIAWNESSWITLTPKLETYPAATARTINLYFYHNQAHGIGLPEVTVSGSLSESTLGGDPVTYAILGNQNLAADDAQIRSVTLALTQDFDGDANHIHIAFSLINGIQQFALSEVELCSTSVFPQAEQLSVKLISEQVKRDGDSVIQRLSCTVVNQGRFTWEWTLPDSDLSSPPLILDATRTSVIEVPQSSSSVGEYSCTVRYHSDTGLPASPASANFTVEVELPVVLYPNTKTVLYEENDLIILECILAGENLGTEDIEWFFKGQKLRNSMKYTIAVSDNIICSYGKCHQSQLQIRQADSTDAGTYTCSYSTLSEEILVTNSTTSSPSEATETSSQQISSQQISSQPSTPLVAGLITTGGFVLLILTVAVILTGVCLFLRRQRSRSQQLDQALIYDYVGPPDPPSERFQLVGNQAYREILPRCQFDAPPLPSNTTEGSGGSEGCESSRQTAEMVQLKDNVAYEQAEIVMYL